LCKWIFVEAADRQYVIANPDMVSPYGLSVDGTSEFLSQLEKTDDRVTYLPYGFSESSNPAQGKCEARQQYLNALESVKPDFFIVLDGDEFYTYRHQRTITTLMPRYKNKTAFIFNRREIWRPPSIVDNPLMGLEVIGGFWKIPCCHWWKWFPGVTYLDNNNHNTPSVGGSSLLNGVVKLDKGKSGPQMVHMGFAAMRKTRMAKNLYYETRGEGKTDHRGWYVKSRAAFDTWKPSDILPRGASVIPYEGPVPEIFQ
jgi:hypothetical protein